VISKLRIGQGTWTTISSPRRTFRTWYVVGGAETIVPFGNRAGGAPETCSE
jgi:hypothetical protein